MKQKVLLVEDESIVARDIRKTLERNGFKVVGVARSVEKAFSLIEEHHPTLALVDIFLKGNLTGIDLAEVLNKKEIPFIYLSANSNQQVLEAAKSTNPYGFVIKPFRERDLLLTLDIASYRYENKKTMDNDRIYSSLDTTIPLSPSTQKEKIVHSKVDQFRCENIIGKSAAMLHVFNLIEQVAPYDTSVLILGESGTGKEGVANCIVQQSPRKNKPFIKVNCAAIPQELMESEFFGHEKGAFTGATEKRIGKFEQAIGGTILLDEVGEITLEMQAKLLRVLQERESQRIGSASTIKADVRILASTSRILEKELSEGKFRLDLYYRLLVFPIRLPPLRSRKEDIPLLIDHFLRYYAGKAGKKIPALDPDTMQKLLHYKWPGNVRQLQHMIERMILSNNNKIDPEGESNTDTTPVMQAKKEQPQVKTLDEVERDYILAILKQCNFKISGTGGAAELLNLSANTLHSKMKKLGIKITHE